MGKINWAEIGNHDLIAEINKRIEGGDMDVTSFEIHVPAEVDYIDQIPGGAEGDALCDLIDEARCRYRRGEYREAIWNLEKALGRDFSGLSDITLGAGK